MARKSKYESRPQTTAQLWRPALYARLSREDGDRMESDSIANQRSLLTEFAAAQEDFAAPVYYQDDGFTGTDFNRPDFERMLRDLRDGTVNCVVVKDLSRFGRNYVAVGEYLESVFPLLGVRFISLNDNVDSVRNPQSMNDLVVPFKNIINDEYCRDISNKVRASLDLRRRQGKFIGSFAAFGYAKDPEDHNRLVIDPEAAAVVRDIFSWFLAGTSILGIAKRLNMQGVPNPTAYKKRQGFRYQHPTAEKNDALWPDSSVRRILKNPVYTGTMVQGRNKIKSYKLHVSVAQPESEWFRVENTHEAIIDPAQFERVQSLLLRDTRTAPGKREVYLFSGFLRCADCGKAMNRKQISQPGREYYYYICSTFKKQNRDACTKHTIRSDRLEEAVLVTLQKQIALAVEMDELIAGINRNGAKQRSTTRLTEERRRLTQEHERVGQLKLALYPDWKNGDLTREEYHALKADFEAQQGALQTRLEALQAEIDEAAKGVDGDNPFLAQFTRHRGLTHLTREIVVELIDMIYVHEGGGLTIRFKFADAYAAAADYIRTHAAPA